MDLSVTSGRTVRTSLGSSLPSAQFQREGTGLVKSEIDLKDAYIIASFYNEMNLMNDYYEYEQDLPHHKSMILFIGIVTNNMIQYVPKNYAVNPPPQQCNKV